MIEIAVDGRGYVARASQLRRAMRWLGLSVLLVAGCTEAGAHLTFSAPNGPMAVSSFRVVLASPEQVPAVSGQRVAPRMLTTQTVSYYLQRTVAGGEHEAIDDLDGFAVRVEPDGSLPDTQFIPFVLMYDGAQGTGNIIAVATFVAPDSQMPSPILVKRDEIDKYTLAVEPVTQVTGMDAPAAGQVEVITCARDQSEFVSGIVWRPMHGGELRLVFPDDDGMDATGRELDLDCDGHAVTAETSAADCDDTRDWFNRDAAESCDGYDTNCDGLQSLAVACAAPTNGCADPATNTGIALCDDRTGTQAQCQSDPQCLCNGVGTYGCIKCIISNELGATAGTVKPCQPGVGYFYTQMCTDLARCKVEVVGVHGGWRAEVSADNVTFGLSATNVSGKFFIKATRPEGPGVEIAGTRGESTGEADVVIATPSGSPMLWPVDLRLELDGTTASCAGAGPYPMLCTVQ